MLHLGFIPEPFTLLPKSHKQSDWVVGYLDFWAQVITYSKGNSLVSLLMSCKHILSLANNEVWANTSKSTYVILRHPLRTWYMNISKRVFMNLCKVTYYKDLCDICKEKSDLNQDDLDTLNTWYCGGFLEDRLNNVAKQAILRAYKWGVSESYFSMERLRTYGQVWNEPSCLDPFDTYSSDWIIENKHLPWTWDLVFLRKEISLDLAKLALSKGVNPYYVRHGYLLSNEVVSLLIDKTLVSRFHTSKDLSERIGYILVDQTIRLFNHYFSLYPFNKEELGMICDGLLDPTRVTYYNSANINRAGWAFSRNPKVTYDLIKAYPRAAWSLDDMLLNPSITLEELGEYVLTHDK